MYHSFRDRERRVLSNSLPASCNNRSLPIQLHMQRQQTLRLPEGKPHRMFRPTFQASPQPCQRPSQNTSNKTSGSKRHSLQQFRPYRASTYRHYPTSNTKAIPQVQLILRHTNCQRLTRDRRLPRNRQVNRPHLNRQTTRPT